MAFFEGSESFGGQWLVYLRLRKCWVAHRNGNRVSTGTIECCLIMLYFHSSISFCFACVWHMWGVLTCERELEARDWCQVSSSILFHIYFLRQDLSLSLEFIGLVRMLANELWASICLSIPPQHWGYRHESQSLGSRDENSGLHMCIASTSHVPTAILWFK